MKVQEEFVVQESPQRLWEFFEQIDRVARCLPGVEDVEVIDTDNSRLRVTQALGPMSATFDMKMRITDRDPGRLMQFTAIGRSVRGAAGNIRTANEVRLEELPDGATRVVLDADVALGGMIGSVGQKVVAKQAGKVTKRFAETLQREIRGEAPPRVVAPGAPGSAAPARPTPVPAPAPAPGEPGAAPAASSSLLTSTVPVPLSLVLAVVFGAGYLAGRAIHRRT
ncbi:MAG TPA: SRPBCC domain-containing protein [Solirubrobacteraceae bacterium]|jgi:hypothetical protein